MKIAIVYPPLTKNGQYPHLTQNRHFRYSSAEAVRIYPLIPASAATLLDRAGYHVLFLDGINRRLTLPEYEAQLAAFNPDVMRIETKAPIVRRHWEYIERIKQTSDARVVLVGDHVTYFPEESLRASRADAVIAGGDYDIALLKLVKHWQAPANAPLPRGVYARGAAPGEILNRGAFELADDLDALPFIDRDLTGWKNYGEAYLQQPCTYLLSGRGCGMPNGHVSTCTFCIWQHSLWKRTARLRSPANVVAEIEEVYRRYGVREVFDDNEAGGIWNAEWVEGFRDEMNRARLVGKVVVSANARANSLTPQVCANLRAAGVRLLKVGLESGNDATLRRLSKGQTVAEVVAGIKCAKDAGLRLHITNMVGYPWETEQDAARTYAVARELLLYKARAGDSLQASVVIPYPGTPLFNDSVKNKWLAHAPDDYPQFDMSHPVMKTPIDTGAWANRLWRLHTEPSFILRSALTIRSWFDVKLLFGGVISLIGHLRDYQPQRAVGQVSKLVLPWTMRLMPLVGLLLFIFFVTRVNVAQTAGIFARADARWIALGVALVVVEVAFKAMRFRALAQPIARCSFTTSVWVYLLGQPFAAITPGQLGDFVKYVPLEQRAGISIGAGLGVGVMERALDVTALLLVGAPGFFLALRWRDILPAASAVPAILVALLALVAAIAARAAWTRLARRGVDFALALYNAKLARANQATEPLVHALTRTAKGQTLVSAAVLSLAAWWVIAARAAAYGAALGLSIHPLYYFALIPTGIVIELLPISFMGIGVREYSLWFLFAPLGASLESILALSLLHFVLGPLPTALVGAGLVARLGRR